MATNYYGRFDEYDLEKIKKANKLLLEVYEYNFGAPRLNRKIKRLETILSKLETLQNME